MEIYTRVNGRIRLYLSREFDIADFFSSLIVPLTFFLPVAVLELSVAVRPDFRLAPPLKSKIFVWIIFEGFIRKTACEMPRRLLPRHAWMRHATATNSSALGTPNALISMKIEIFCDESRVMPIE
jgi:hypothetical protein